MHHIEKALKVARSGRTNSIRPDTQTNVLFVTTEAPDQTYAREAASHLASMVAVLDISARRVGVEVVPSIWQKFRWTFYAVGMIVMFAIGGFSIGVILDDIDTVTVIENHGVSTTILSRKECYDRIKGVACMNGDTK